MADQQQIWQQALDRAAYFNVLAVPDRQQPNVPISMPGHPNSLAGVHIKGVGHRFVVTVRQPSSEIGLRASNVVGAAVLNFSFRWLLIPHEFEAAPGREPPPTSLDTCCSQRFAIMDAEFRLSPDGENRFSSIGAGRTFPLHRAGRPSLSIAGVGAILEGSNKFQGHPGVYVISGFFTPPDDFRFNILIRVNDAAGDLLTDAALPPVEAVADPPLTTTYLYVRTANLPETTNLTLGPGGAPQRLETREQIMLDHLDFVAQAPYGLGSRRDIGPVIGQHPLTARFFPSPATQGTAASPIPFNDVEEFIFTDSSGRSLGSVTAPVIEGRSILTPIEGIPQELAPQIFGGFAPITGGMGQFAGMSGIVTNVGGGTIGPHLSDILYMFELADPTGKYRVAARHDDV
jgi:hypothetical protein